MSDLSQHRQAYAFCAFCPKVCRFACPVSESTAQESTSTWAKMSSAFLVTQSHRALDEAAARTLYACTGCMRCRTHCAHQNEVGFALFSARELAIEGHQAPPPVNTTLATFRAHQNPFGVDLAPLVARYKPETPVRYPLFPGCSALVKGEQVIADTLVVGEALGAPLGVCKVAGRCCGYPLYAAGDLTGFARHAQAFAAQLQPYPELVVIDPGCAYTLKVVYPRVGVEVPTRVRTIYEVLAEHLGHAPARPKLPLKAAYHDPCHLGRGLSQYEEPRALLLAAVEELLEGQASREDGCCSGGGGLLPRTHGTTSADIARRTAERLAPADAPDRVVVTSCPTSRRMFERAGRRAEDLVAVMRRWLRPA